MSRNRGTGLISISRSTDTPFKSLRDADGIACHRCGLACTKHSIGFYCQALRGVVDNLLGGEQRMRFGLILSASCEARLVEHDNLLAAQREAGLPPGMVDHALLLPASIAAFGVSIVVYEFGLRADPEREHFFALGGELFAGSAVLYAHDHAGVTVDMPNRMPQITFLGRGPRRVERAIDDGVVRRPSIRLCSAGVEELAWQWHAPPYFPSLEERRAAERSGR